MLIFSMLSVKMWPLLETISDTVLSFIVIVLDRLVLLNQSVFALVVLHNQRTVHPFSNCPTRQSISRTRKRNKSMNDTDNVMEEYYLQTIKTHSTTIYSVIQTRINLFMVCKLGIKSNA